MSLISWKNFSAGELSPLLSGRTDLDIYFRGAKKIENFVPINFGGLKRRTGFRYMGKLNSVDISNEDNYKVRLIPYKFSANISYIIELTDKLFRVISTDGYIENSSSTSILSVITQYKAEDIHSISYAQNGDKLYLCHEDYPVQIIEPTATGWKISNMSFNSKCVPVMMVSARFIDDSTYPYVGKSRPIYYHVVAVDQDGVPSAVSIISNLAGRPEDLSYRYYMYITWNAVPNAKEYLVYEVDDTFEGYIGVAKRNSFYEKGLFPTNYSKGYPQTISSFSGEGNYPSQIAFYDRRLIFAATKNEPYTIWGSVPEVYHNFTTETVPTDTCAWKFTLASDQKNKINWMISGDKLFLGTEGDEWRISGKSGETITATSIEIRRVSSWGSTSITPYSLGDDILFINNTKQLIRSLNYSDNSSTNNLNIYAEHLTKNRKIIDWTLSKNDNQIIYIILDDGMLLGLTYDKVHQIFAWHKYITNGKFLSASIIFDGKKDKLFTIIEREINGKKNRYLELLDDDCYLDSYITYSGDPITTISGLDHLSGSEVSVMIDNIYHKKYIVDSVGTINLDLPATNISVGFSYESIIETLPLESLFSSEPLQARSKKITQISLKIIDTLGLEVGVDNNKLIPLKYDDITLTDSIKSKLFTGIKSIKNLSGYDIDCSIIVKQKDPFPTTILSIFAEIKI